ncbi:MAG: cysteine desulfurase family protein [Burkholderiales bacterium]
MMHVYFDHNASTPLDPRVLEVMLPFLHEQCGNASSRHEFGTVARKAVDRAREQVAAIVGAQPAQVVFTSGGTEANNLFIRGMAAGMKPGQVAVSSIEHPCVTAPAQDLARQGWKLRKLKVNCDGRIDLNDVDAALAEKTALMSVMLANNETGVIQDIATVGERAKRAGAVMHTDAVQALGKIPVEFSALNVQALTLSAHKIYGPKGAGALVVDKRLDLRAVLTGGGQERGLRGGTENVPAIVGFGVACEIAAGRLKELGARLSGLRERLEQGLTGMGAVIFGNNAPRLPNTSYFAFRGIHGETLVIELDKSGYAVGSGAACSSTDNAPSGTLLAMGVEPELARGAVRFSLGADNSAEQVDGFLRALSGVLQRLRTMQAVAV